MTGLRAEGKVAVPLLSGQWLSTVFVHWPFKPADVQAHLPPRLTVDVYEGSAWVSLVAFVIAEPRVLVGRRLCRIASIAQTNLRTYVCGPGGTDGLWFFSVDAASAGMALAGRLGPGGPYYWSDLRVDTVGDRWSYSGRRRGGTQSYSLVVDVGDLITPSERDVWLTGRWRAYTRRLGALLVTPVEHEPWRLAAATVVVLRENLLACAGLPAPSAEPLAHCSLGSLNLRAGITRPVRWTPA